ncbi:MAG: SWIM zinc finger family protein [Bacteroidota bacterium]
MTIHNFEQFVEPKILERGSSYYHNNMVQEVEQLEKGEFSAEVMGSGDDYEVFVKLDEAQNIVESRCTCPYDWGDTCKHEVALYYTIKIKKLYKEKISKDAIELMYKIDQMSVAELKTCLHDILKRDRELRAEFLEDY